MIKWKNNIFIKNLGFGNTKHFFKFVAPLVLSDNTKIIDIDNNNENDSLLYENIRKGGAVLVENYFTKEYIISYLKNTIMKRM